MDRPAGLQGPLWSASWQSVSFAQGAIGEQFAELASAIEHREKDDHSPADGEQQPVRAHALLAVAIDPFSPEPRDETASQGHGFQAGHDVRGALPHAAAGHSSVSGV